MAEKREMSSRRVPDEKAASPEEIRTAIDALSDAELLRLEKYAKFKINGLGRKGYGLEGNDLLHEALVDTVDGVRRWNKSVDFARHLHEAVRSIASNKAKQFKDVLETEVSSHSPDGRMINPMLKVPSADPNPEQALAKKQEHQNTKRGLEQVEALLDGDPKALEVFGGLRAEMTGPEIREALDLTQNEYETVMRRICRKARAGLR